MKIFILILHFLVLNTVDKSFLKLTNDEVILSIGKDATDDQLSNFKKQLADKKITIHVDELKRDAGEKIVFIKISVNCGDEFSGSVGQKLTKDKPFVGFYRNYTIGAKSPFGMTPAP